jgi:hypothetical protein
VQYLNKVVIGNGNTSVPGVESGDTVFLLQTDELKN